jgi:20S proteasome alpha/beta subunit
MTCVVAVVKDDVVHMAADRGASDDSVMLVSNDKKILKRAGYLIGYAGNYGLGQLIQHGLVLPRPPRNYLLKFMRTDFHKAVQATIKKYDYQLTYQHEDSQSDFLIGVKGELFEYDPLSGQVAPFEETAIGAGAEIALGSLYSTRNSKTPDKRVFIAVKAACYYSTSCREPIDYETL